MVVPGWKICYRDGRRRVLDPASMVTVVRAVDVHRDRVTDAEVEMLRVTELWCV
jgi:hypothetical protein